MRPWVRRVLVVGALAGVAVAAVAAVAARRRRSPRVPAAPLAPPVPAWIDPDDAGDCPVSHPIKGKVRTGIFHPPGAFAYGRTHADRCYRDAEAAEADGLRAAKR
jgi:hypothetical protein